MKIVHVIPRPCIFEVIVKQHADKFGHECFYYTIKNRFGMDLYSFRMLYAQVRKQPNSLFIFHRVPHSVVLALSLLNKDFKYALLYWGEDYYSNFLGETYLENHCIAKSPLLNEDYYKRSMTKPRPNYQIKLLSYVSLLAIKRATGIVSLCPKQFRFIRFVYFKHFGIELKTPQFWFQGYSPVDDVCDYYPPNDRIDKSLKILICHSASASVAHKQTLELLRLYKKKWNANIFIYGFLSYSGGDESSRNQLERELIEQSDFAENIFFERLFYTLKDLEHRIKDVDIAVFSCLRDEGVSLLTQYVKLGGVVCFNRFSMNYDFFKIYAPSKLLTHEEFLANNPEQIKEKRLLSVPHPPRMLNFEEFDKLKLNDGKLTFPNSRPYR